MLEDACHAIAAMFVSTLLKSILQSYSRQLCSRRAKGACGSVIVSQALGTWTSMIAFRLTFRSIDLEPRVATSLFEVSKTLENGAIAYQMVATPCLRSVRTAAGQQKTDGVSVKHTLMAVKHD